MRIHSRGSLKIASEDLGVSKGMRIQNLSILALVFSLALTSPAYADLKSQPLNPTDNQSPALVSVALEKKSASANSMNSILLTIKDDKNSMFIPGTLEFEAPPGTGTLFRNEGFSPLVAPPLLINQQMLSDGIQETWKIQFKVPSVVGVWMGYRIDFSDLATNSVQFLNKTPGVCANTSRYKYPNQSPDSLDVTPCTFDLALIVTPEESGNIAKVSSPEYEAALKKLDESKRALISVIQLLDKTEKAQAEKSVKAFLDFEPGAIAPGMSVPMQLSGFASSILLRAKNIDGLTAKFRSNINASKKTTITCVKGKISRKVTAVKPKCPSGFKLKK